MAKNVRVRNGQWDFTVQRNNRLYGTFGLRLPGTHNVLNALGVIAVSHAFGIPKAAIRKALASFHGTRRRFEYVGRYRGAILIDDYAHHPTEIRATLKAARELYPAKRIIAVFHPHTYSRTKALLGDFAQSFTDADEVIVLDIYSSAREKRGSVGSRELVKLAKQFHAQIRHIPTIPQTAKYLKKILRRNDVLLTLGAGDVWRVLGQLKKNS